MGEERECGEVGDYRRQLIKWERYKKKKDRSLLEQLNEGREHNRHGRYWKVSSHHTLLRKGHTISHILIWEEASKNPQITVLKRIKWVRKKERELGRGSESYLDETVRSVLWTEYWRAFFFTDDDEMDFQWWSLKTSQSEGILSRFLFSARITLQCMNVMC